MSKQYTLITDYSASQFLFKELAELMNVDTFIVDKRYPFLVRVIRQIHFRLPVPYKDLWYRFNILKKMIKHNSTIIVNSLAFSMPSSICWYSLKKEYPDVKFVLVLVDSLDSHSQHLKKCKNLLFEFPWDLVLSYDKNDCEKYGFKFMGYAYYSKLNDIEESSHVSDLYYVGAVKFGRDELLRKLNEASKNNKTNNFFKIVSLTAKIDYGKVCRRFIPYEKVISDVLSTNCILEVLMPNQFTQSVRYFEAVCYNKKLLSNNPNLSTLPYYDSRYMRYFEKVEDVDWEWVKKKEDIDYGYKRDFSSARILDVIEKYLEAPVSTSTENENIFGGGKTLSG